MDSNTHPPTFTTRPTFPTAVTPPHPTSRAHSPFARNAPPFSWLLLFLLTISVALRSDASSGDDEDGGSGGLQSYPWLECLAPLWAVDLLYAGVAGYVAANTMAGRFVMAPTQGLCFALLVAALAGSTVAEMLLTGDHRYGMVLVIATREVFMVT